MTAAAIDACLCLLLISAAAVTVTSVPASPGVAHADRADAVAETLAATTADVAYTLEPTPKGATDPDTNSEYERVAHGTLASLLADVAIRTVHVDGDALTRTNTGFATAVRAAVDERLPPRTRVVVRWRPFPDAHLGREFAVGNAPPQSADVHAETIRVPSGVDPPETAGVASEERYAGLARVVVNSIVDGILPPEKGRLALADDAPLDDLVRHRYQRVSDRYGVDTSAAVERGDTRAANRQIAAAMADRVASDLRQGTGSPEAAVELLALDTVEISVRTWSP
ncbi:MULTISPECIES: DUF7284 family protein [Halolamina]|uniref:Uncharacterized protein n=1 Tax=Halolamina pelagica TaxID=699431 RepID=A0A1I5R201_9EURY|nr:MULTISPECIES: hypothetical protein [Halolamina]NHX35643.1 hypothetical protein [Halolamina sp. R1-12]SFP52367.1 hypothetical protein SAMN05216277_104194 [Halolamina pelagica]